MSNYPWKNKVANSSQIAGIETSVIDNGPAKGTRIAWVTTGSGLRFKVAIDRGLDIIDAFYKDKSLAFISHGGLTSPRPDADHDLTWLETFPGGLVVTCGLTHTGPPEEDEKGKRGLHGKISNIPAELQCIKQPDLHTDDLDIVISGVMRESVVFGNRVEMIRTISCKVGEPAIKIKDEVTNKGNQRTPHMLLYHCNFGWPLIDEGTEFVYNGKCKSRGGQQDDEIFNSEKNYKICRTPLDQHRGPGEACGFIDVEENEKGWCNASVNNKKISLELTLRYLKDQLPCLSNWQHFGPGEYVAALEPGTNFPIGRKEAEKQGTLKYIEPGETKECFLEILVNEKGKTVTV